VVRGTSGTGPFIWNGTPSTLIPRLVLMAEFTPLTRSPFGALMINRKVPFPDASFQTKLSSDAIERCLKFAHDMVLGNGAHRVKRTGGKQSRDKALIFRDTLQGKLAEFAVCEHLTRAGVSVSPDFSVAPLGSWDSGDISLGGYEIAVKSAKHFSNLLLLECVDWKAPNVYLHGRNGSQVNVDAVVFARVKLPGLPSRTSGSILSRLSVFEDLPTAGVQVDIPGYTNGRGIENCILSNLIIPSGAMLNGTVEMEVDNYYIQAGDLDPFERLASGLSSALAKTRPRA